MDFPLPFSDDERGLSPRFSPSPSYSSGVHSVFESHHIFNESFDNGLQIDTENPIHTNDTCTVYLARSKINKKEYTVVKKTKLKNRLQVEFTNYSRIPHHQNIILCFQMWQIERYFYLQLELAEYGSIVTQLFSFETQEIFRLFTHILLALNHIHSCNYMHLDISPSNILCCKDDKLGYIYKLGDFGTLLPIGHFTADSEGAGPYVSPEALSFPNTDYEVGAPTDIFSLGLVMFELVTRKVAPRVFPGYQQIRSGSYDLSSIPEEFSFIPHMLSPNPNDRPTAAQLLELDQCQHEINLLHPSVVI